MAVASLTALTFLPALRNGFVNWDDQGHFAANPWYRGLGWDQLRWMFTTFHLGNYQPVSWLTYGLDYAVWGMDPFGYHLSNVLLHAANALLFYFLSLRLAAGGGREPEDGLGAAFAALLFSLHPLRVESVAWASERRDVLSAFFFLLTLLSWLRAVRSGGGLGRRWSALAWFSYLLALLSKAMVITLPAVLVVLDLYPLRRLPASPRQWLSARYRGIWIEKLPFLAPALVLAMIGLLAQQRVGALPSMARLGLIERLAQSLFGLGFYLGKTLLPLRLSPHYEWHWQTDRLLFLSGGALALAAASALAARRERWPAGLAAFSYYAITLAPVIGLFRSGYQTFADRYTYLPCLGWALLSGAGLSFLARAWRERRPEGGAFVPSCFGAALLLGLLASLTLRQIPAWRDSPRLWRHVLGLNAASTVARPNLASALFEQGRADEAVLYLEEQLEIYPGDEESRRMLSRIIAGTWRAEADLAKIHVDLGADLIEQGESEKGVWHFARAAQLDPSLWQASHNLGLALYRAGRIEDAIREYERGLRSAPAPYELHNSLAIALARLGRLDEAIGHFEAALRIKADYEPARAGLRLARERKGRP